MSRLPQGDSCGPTFYLEDAPVEPPNYGMRERWDITNSQGTSGRPTAAAAAASEHSMMQHIDTAAVAAGGATRRREHSPPVGIPLRKMGCRYLFCTRDYYSGSVLVLSTASITGNVVTTLRLRRAVRPSTAGAVSLATTCRGASQGMSPAPHVPYRTSAILRSPHRICADKSGLVFLFDSNSIGRLAIERLETLVIY